MSRAFRPVLCALLAVSFTAGLFGAGAGCSDPRQGYEPYQPIYFQHLKMAGKPNWVKDATGKDVNLGGYDIQCVYCHNMPYKGRHSTIADVNTCMNCHAYAGQDKEWIIKLKQYWESGTPVPWVKVHDLPDFVYYDHSMHLNARNAKGLPKVACVDCHGALEAKPGPVSVQNAFNMGWCLDCHRKPEIQAPTDCWVCHR